MNNKTFPRSAGPYVGFVAGAIIGLRLAIRNPGDAWPSILRASLLGTVGGCVVALLDRSPSTHRNDEVDHLFGLSGDEEVRSEPPAPLIPRFLALVSALAWWLPVAGVVIGIISCYVNRRTSGWPRTVSRGSLAISAIFTSVAVAFLMFVE